MPPHKPIPLYAYPHHIRMLIIAAALLATALSQQPCPASVADELELISLPLDCFHQLYRPGQFDGNRMTRVVNERLEVYRRMLQALKMQDWEHVQTSPVVKWAQSAAQVFIGFKLSHRQDSPTCSDIRAESFRTRGVNATEGNIAFEEDSEGSTSSFEFRGECYFTSEKLLFTLSLQFEHPLARLQLSKQGLGQYTLVGDKATHQIWVSPFTDSRKAAIWSEMRYKHSGDMDKYFEIIEEQASSHSTRSKGRRRRRPKKPEQEEPAKPDKPGEPEL